jgi:hypothetical protein
MRLTVSVSIVLLLSASLQAVALPRFERDDSVVARRAPASMYPEIEARSPFGLDTLFKGLTKGISSVCSLARYARLGSKQVFFASLLNISRNTKQKMR